MYVSHTILGIEALLNEYLTLFPSTCYHEISFFLIKAFETHHSMWGDFETLDLFFSTCSWIWHRYLSPGLLILWVVFIWFGCYSLSSFLEDSLCYDLQWSKSLQLPKLTKILYLCDVSIIENERVWKATCEHCKDEET